MTKGTKYEQKIEQTTHQHKGHSGKAGQDSTNHL